jgi:hypothetical protein
MNPSEVSGWPPPRPPRMTDQQIEEFRESLDTPTLSDSRRYREAPPRILDSIRAYVEHRRAPGGFLMAVLSNDLRGAFQAADGESRRGLGTILRFLNLEVPATCWGSPAKVAAWLRRQLLRALG